MNEEENKYTVAMKVGSWIFPETNVEEDNIWVKAAAKVRHQSYIFGEPTVGSFRKAQSAYFHTISILEEQQRKSTMYSYRSDLVESCSSPSTTRIHN